MPFAASLNEEAVRNFFEVELGMPHDALSRLAEEGTERPEDSIELTSSNAKTVTGNLRWPGGRAPDEVSEDRAVLAHPLKLSAKAALRLENTTGTMEYCETL